MTLQAALRRSRMLAVLTAVLLLAIPLTSLVLGGRDAVGFAALFTLALAAALCFPLILRQVWDRGAARMQVEHSLDWAVPAAMTGASAATLGLGELSGQLRIPGVLGGRGRQILWHPLLGNHRRVKPWSCSRSAVSEIGYVELAAGITSELALVLTLRHQGEDVELDLRVRRAQLSLEVLQASPLASLLRELPLEG